MKERIEKMLGQIMNTKAIVIIFIVGIGLMLLPGGSTKDNKEVMDKKEYASQTYKTNTERSLEKILSSVHGVGSVSVMITLFDEGETLYAKDESAENRTESDDRQSTGEHTFVLKNDAGGGESPIVVRKSTPSVSGVLVVASGAKDPLIKEEIVSAVRAVLGVKAHRIEVLQKK